MSDGGTLAVPGGRIVDAEKNVEQLVINTFNRAAQRAGELGRGIARALRRLGVDEVDDCLSLGEVELSVQERPRSSSVPSAERMSP